MSTDSPQNFGHKPSHNLGGYQDGAAPGDDMAFAERVTRYLDWGLTDAELAHFNARLLADPGSRELFVRFVRLHGMLSERALSMEPSLTEDEFPILASSSDSSHAPVKDPASESLDDAVIHPAIREEQNQAVGIGGIDGGGEEVSAQSPWNSADQNSSHNLSPWEPARQDAATNRIPPDRNRNLPIRSGIAALLILGFSLSLWAWLRNSNHTPETLAVTPTPPAPSLVEPPVVLGDSINAQFDASGAQPAPVLVAGQAMPEGPLSLKTGWIRINFPSGVTAIVEAPAHFSVQSRTLMTLGAGRLSAEVPLAGHGFTVQAPFCQVVDLGTEFGIAVDPQGRHMVEVFKGLVQLNRPLAAGKEAGSEVLSQGSVRQIESIQEPSISTSAVPTTFLRKPQFEGWRRTLDLGEKASLTDRWRSYSEQLSRDPSLALYYTFNDRDSSPDEIKNRAFSTAGQYNIPMAAPAPSWTDGRLPSTASLKFDPAQNQRLLLPSYPLTTNGELTCTAWVYAHSLTSWASIAKSWGNTRCGAFHLGLLADSGFLEIELDGTRPGGPRISENQRFPIGRWVHIAFTNDGKMLRLYRDGKEVASVPSRPISPDQPIKTLSLGVKTDDDGTTPSVPPQCGYWDGKIGEFALFHRALSAEEIARMNEYGPR